MHQRAHATRGGTDDRKLEKLSKGALNDLSGVFAAMREDSLDGLIEEIVKAKRIVVFGLGREGLQMRGFAMRLFHMGRNAAVWGDMTTSRWPRAISSSPPPDPAISQRRANAGRRRAQGGRAHGSWSPPSQRAGSPGASTF